MADSNVAARSAFILRMSPSGVDRMTEALESNEVVLGWSRAGDFTGKEVSWEEVRNRVHQTFYSTETQYYKTGLGAGNIWRFVKKMQKGDLVVVPYGPNFYVAEVTGPARYDSSKVDEDTANRRPVNWLNRKNPIPRTYARAALLSRMKAYQACVDADDLVNEVQEILSLCEKGRKPSFQEDLRMGLVDRTVKELRGGRIGPDGFEKLIASVLTALGAASVKVIPHRIDKGADVLAEFELAETTTIRLAVQAKHYLAEPPVGPSAIDELVAGMEAEDADAGWVVTSGTFDAKTEEHARKLREEQNLKIELLDGVQFASLIVEGGLRELS